MSHAEHNEGIGLGVCLQGIHGTTFRDQAPATRLYNTNSVRNTVNSRYCGHSRDRDYGNGITCIYIYIDCSTNQNRFGTSKEHGNLYVQTEWYSTKQNLQKPLYSTEDSALSILIWVPAIRYCTKSYHDDRL